MSDIELSVVLPAYMEEENLRVLLPRLNRVLEGLQVRSEIIVVDTLQPLDKTAEACALNGASYLNRVGGNSFGDAVRTGIGAARGRFTLFMDADGSHTPEFIPEMFKLREQHDVVIASRYVPGGYTENTLVLILMSRAVNLCYSWVLNLKCNDVSNNFKIYRTAQLKALTLKCNNFDIVEEILFKLSRVFKGLRMREVPFSFKKRMFGETKRNLVLFMLTYVSTILKLRFMRIGSLPPGNPDAKT
jgi:dolichol-phosphate mannosyltransferase